MTGGRKEELERREFLKLSSGLLASTALSSSSLASSAFGQRQPAAQAVSGSDQVVLDSLDVGPEWETLNPGFWQIRDGHLRRRIGNYGDRARSTGFPYHYETHGQNNGVMPVDYDPSLPPGVLYRRDLKLTGNWSISGEFVVHGHVDVRRKGDAEDWKMYQPGYGRMGLAFGAKNLFESYNKVRNAWFVGWLDDGRFGFLPGSRRGGRREKLVDAPAVSPGEKVQMTVQAEVSGDQTRLTATLTTARGETVSVTNPVSVQVAEGYAGVVGQGLLDFSVRSFEVDSGQNVALQSATAECLTCYPLGDTLAERDGTWTVRFVALFASEGLCAEVRVADSPNPEGGWERVGISGAASIVTNDWRRNTASIDVVLPTSPAAATLYYTVWKDGQNVTADSRIGTDSCGPGTGYVGDVPASGEYVGRLPRLQAPYRICGLSCHAITSGLQQRTEQGWQIRGGGDAWQFRDQPTAESYRHLEDYRFQVMCWEDDVWYLELVLYPPSTDDAYRMIAATICGPTTRWQMMRHWNVINPGDHDYGMDDVKGPEQLVLRLRDGLGQDRDYLRRNFQIVQHLISGDEEVDPLANPKKWRAWKMPNRDFTLAILDSRLWRSSQDTAIWDDEGWGHLRELYDRADPTRSLLGEEQFAWLQQLVRTDAARLICLTGINGLHTVWTGGKAYSRAKDDFPQRDRVAADYAGWVAAGADRVIELLGSRDGIVSIYGDVHNGCIMKNRDHRLIECSFGPIGRSGGRSVIHGFGRVMQDYDKRPLEVTALYHKTYADPDFNPHADGEPFYWNFLEMEFDPVSKEPQIGLRIRNLVDPPDELPRGGGFLQLSSLETGRRPESYLPRISTLPHADVRVVQTTGVPVRGTRSDASGMIPQTGLVQVPPGTQVIVTAFDGERSESTVCRTLEAD